jgi:hypothetical protein
LEAAEMQARSAALRKDKSQGVFLAAVEERVRVAYDPAAAHDLASGDIELRQTGMSTFDFVGISGERIPGGIVGSTTVVTGVEEELGRPVVIPVPEAHTMRTLPTRTLLLSGCMTTSTLSSSVARRNSVRCGFHGSPMVRVLS